MLHPHVLRDMALFVEVAKRGSFSRAAAALDMPISSLSRRIVLFEQAVGLRLIERTTRKLALTRHGQTYLPRATRLVEEAQRTVEDMLAEATGPSPQLRIAVPPEAWIVRVLSGALAEAELPERIHVHVEFAETSDSAQAEEFDLVVRIGRAVGAVVPLAELATCLFASPAYLDRRGVPDHPSDLDRHAIILVGQGRAAEWRLCGTDGTATAHVAARLSCTSTVLACRLAVHGLGIVTAGPVEIGDALARGRLVRVLPGWRLPDRALYAVTTCRPLPPDARKLVEGIVRRLGETAIGPLRR